MCTTYLLRLQCQVQVRSLLMSLMMVTMKYCLWMSPPLLMLPTLKIHSLLQRALPSSLTGCTTFWQTQVCVCVDLCMSVCMCTSNHACVHANRQVCRHAYMRVHACLCVCVCVCMCVYVRACMHGYVLA